MYGLTDRIRRLLDRTTDLTTKIENFSDIVIEPDFICKIKRGLISGPISPLGIKSIHTGHSQAIAKIISRSDNISVDFFIDDILDSDIKLLEYEITNLDLKSNNSEILATVYQENGIIRIEKMSLQYSEETKRYFLQILSDKSFSKGRLFISTNTIVHLESHIRPVVLEPLPIGNPGNGSGCRVENSSNNQESLIQPDQKIFNPFK